MFSGMPVLPRNSTSARLTSWEATAWLGSLLLETAGETVVLYTKPLRQQDINIYIHMATANACFFTYVETTWNKINRELLSWLWPLFDLPIFVGQSIDTPSALNLSLSTSCRARAPLEECKSTWLRKTYVANVWRVWFTSQESSECKFFGPAFKWPESTPFRAFMVGAPGSNIPAGWVNDN